MSGTDKAAVTPLRPRRPCPECGRPSARDSYPFCSARCKDIDLNRWLKGAYAIPVRDDEETPEDPDPSRNDG
ncbi:DNA gyrase inhibitor YacG [Mesorhizobium sp. SP-1A]|uniref:DNA gyrase inhibitor YacG n=1 Tax=Mesorhizobium sp. SP-1A TaxID=3077840 RepID=UPI0028F73748|nr:DNA gyrase inhibitor YacG [Mesorhizobium sp. SP-1A]